MSIPVSLPDLAEQSARFPTAFLVSVDPNTAPRVNSISRTVHGSVFRFDVGKRTAANLLSNPKATLLFPPPWGETMALLVDGTAQVDDQKVSFTPSSAVLHQTVAPGPARNPA